MESKINLVSEKILSYYIQNKYSPPKGEAPNAGGGDPNPLCEPKPPIGEVLPKPVPWDANEPNVGELALAKLERLSKN